MNARFKKLIQYAETVAIVIALGAGMAGCIQFKYSVWKEYHPHGTWWTYLQD